mgnify:CR=1 FL=1
MCLAIPGKIIAIQQAGDPTFLTGKVSFGGIQKQVNLSLVPEAKINDYVLVHVGVALSRVNEAEALKVFRYLEEMGEVNELLPNSNDKQ